MPWVENRSRRIFTLSSRNEVERSFFKNDIVLERAERFPFAEIYPRLPKSLEMTAGRITNSGKSGLAFILEVP